MSKKVLIIVIISFVLILGLVGAGFYLILTKVSSLNGEKNTSSQTDAEPEPHATMIGPIASLETFIVNLADSDGKRYLRTSIDLELSDEIATEEINKRLPQVRDGVLMILTTKNLAGLQTVEGKAALREEIITTVNNFLNQGHITNIYFTEFVFQ